MDANIWALGVDRVRRKLRGLSSGRRCARQADALAGRGRPIVTIFYDVEGDYARRGATRRELDCVGRILEIEARYAIRSTYNVVARFALDAPSLIESVRDAGHEIASHSYDHSILTRLPGSALVDHLRRTRDTFDALGVAVVGHRSPQSAWNERVLDALLSTGYAWNAENGAEPYPYRIRTSRDLTLWRFPVAGDDWQYESEGCAPAQMLERWRGQVQAARGRRSHVAIGFHPWVESAPGRLTALEELFHWLVDDAQVDVMPFGDVLRIAAAAPQPAVAYG
ncbi:MAG TPA: polysaccharide deacetylase family protein [Gammaproteobacteria bacterium]